MLGGGGSTGGDWRRLCLGCEWNGSGGHCGKVALVPLGPSSPSLRELTPYSTARGGVPLIQSRGLCPAMQREDLQPSALVGAQASTRVL